MHAWKVQSTNLEMTFSLIWSSGTLILVRHGQTTMNYNKTFTGWIDTDLSEVGKREVLMMMVSLRLMGMLLLRVFHLHYLCINASISQCICPCLYVYIISLMYSSYFSPFSHTFTSIRLLFELHLPDCLKSEQKLVSWFNFVSTNVLWLTIIGNAGRALWPTAHREGV